jgi:hypothetical protein
MIFRMPADADRSHGLRKSIGGFTTVLLVSQEKVTFALSHTARMLTVAAPLTGMAEALAAARRDPIGLVAMQQTKAEKPSMATLKVRSSQK